jgi:hypothetical protein
LTDVAHAEAADVDAAVQAARAAFEGPWSRMKANERERLIWRIGDLLSERAETFGQLESVDNGKSAIVAQTGGRPPHGTAVRLVNPVPFNPLIAEHIDDPMVRDTFSPVVGRPSLPAPLPPRYTRTGVPLGAQSAVCWDKRGGRHGQ